jgi:hypothetical protein
MGRASLDFYNRGAFKMSKYLESRGIVEAIKFLNYKEDQHSITFLLGNEGATNTRFFNPKGRSKYQCRGDITPLLWTPRGELDSSRAIFITEGVIDSLSLLEHNYQAISAISASSNPANKKWLIENIKNFQFIIGFDGDAAGRKGALKYYNFIKENGGQAHIALTRTDWNNLLLAGELNDKTIKAAINNGSEFIIQSFKEAQQKKKTNVTNTPVRKKDYSNSRDDFAYYRQNLSIESVLNYFNFKKWDSRERTAGGYRVSSPFRTDTNPSFSVSVGASKDGGDLFNDFTSGGGHCLQLIELLVGSTNSFQILKIAKQIAGDI